MNYKELLNYIYQPKTLIVLGLFFVTSACFSDGNIYLVDLISNFKHFFFLLAMACSMVFLYKKDLLVIVTVFIAWVNFQEINYHEDEFNSPIHLKIIHMNVLSSNSNHRDFIKVIQAESPDVIGVQEVSLDWAIILEQSLRNYRYKLILPQRDNFGIAILSKYPIKLFRSKYYHELGTKSLEGRIKIPQGEIPFSYTHPIPPIHKAAFKNRNKQILTASRSLQHERNALLFGDFNTTPWSSFMKSKMNDSPLTLARGGIWSTWPVNLSPVGIPLDHFMYGPNLKVHVRRLDKIGSDHFPIIAEINVIDTIPLNNRCFEINL